MNALELIEESERVGYALGIKDSKTLSDFSEWVITLVWPTYNKEKDRLEHSTLEDLRKYFPNVKAHPKNVKEIS